MTHKFVYEPSVIFKQTQSTFVKAFKNRVIFALLLIMSKKKKKSRKSEDDKNIEEKPENSNSNSNLNVYCTSGHVANLSSYGSNKTNHLS